MEQAAVRLAGLPTSYGCSMLCDLCQTHKTKWVRLCEPFSCYCAPNTPIVRHVFDRFAIACEMTMQHLHHAVMTNTYLSGSHGPPRGGWVAHKCGL